jgi:hypothetical protein
MVLEHVRSPEESSTECEITKVAKCKQSSFLTTIQTTISL